MPSLADAQLLECVARGVPVTNRLLGLDIELPRESAWYPPAPGSTDDEQFGHVFASQLGLASGIPWREAIAGARDFVPHTPLSPTPFQY